MSPKVRSAAPCGGPSCCWQSGQRRRNSAKGRAILRATTSRFVPRAERAYCRIGSSVHCRSWASKVPRWIGNAGQWMSLKQSLFAECNRRKRRAFEQKVAKVAKIYVKNWPPPRCATAPRPWSRKCPRFAKRKGARETREKTRKGDERY